MNYSARYLPIKYRLSVGVFSAVAAAPDEIWTGVTINILTNIYCRLVCLNSVERVRNREAIRLSSLEQTDAMCLTFWRQRSAGDGMLADLLQSVSWPRNCTPFGGPTGTVSALCTAECRGAPEPSLYVHRYKASRYFVHPVTATDVIYIILITIRSSKQVNKLLWIELTAWGSPSWEANRYSASQEFHGTGSLITAFTRCHTCPYPEPARSTP